MPGRCRQEAQMSLRHSFSVAQNGDTHSENTAKSMLFLLTVKVYRTYVCKSVIHRACHMIPE